MKCLSIILLATAFYQPLFADYTNDKKIVVEKGSILSYADFSLLSKNEQKQYIVSLRSILAKMTKSELISHKQLIDYLLPKAYAETKNLRCMWGGFIVKNNEDCRPIKRFSLVDANNNKQDISCGKNQALCNPLIYGLTAAGKGICEKAHKFTTQDCNDRVSKINNLDATIAAIKNNASAWNQFRDNFNQLCGKGNPGLRLDVKARASSLKDVKDTCAVALNRISNLNKKLASIKEKTLAPLASLAGKNLCIDKCSIQHNKLKMDSSGKVKGLSKRKEKVSCKFRVDAKNHLHLDGLSTRFLSKLKSKNNKINDTLSIYGVDTCDATKFTNCSSTASNIKGKHPAYNFTFSVDSEKPETTCELKFYDKTTTRSQKLLAELDEEKDLCSGNEENENSPQRAKIYDHLKRLLADNRCDLKYLEIGADAVDGQFSRNQKRKCKRLKVSTNITTSDRLIIQAKPMGWLSSTSRNEIDLTEADSYTEEQWFTYFKNKNICFDSIAARLNKKALIEGRNSKGAN